MRVLCTPLCLTLPYLIQMKTAIAWRINMEVMEQRDSEERRVLMALSQAYQEWEQQTRQQGLRSVIATFF